nr:DinB family protein [uncultured Flavobacterium sp.]
MQSTFEINHTSRNALAKFLENYSLEQLNKIPEGFSNNLIWNIAHIVVVQQMLVYKLSGLPIVVSDEMVEKYKRGTKPESNVTQEEVDELKKLLFTTLEKAEKDFGDAIFKQYSEFTTMSGFLIKDAKAAMEFNNYHEAVHTGIMMQIRKFI